MVRDSLRGFRAVMVVGSSMGPYIAATMADAMKIIRWYRRRLAEYLRLSLCGEYLRAIGRRNAVFLWIPKNAGSSLYRLVGGSRLLDIHAVRYRFAGKGMVTFGHMDYAMLVDRGFVSRRFDGSAFKFAFCRNPYDRAVSLFSYLQTGPHVSVNDSFLDFCRRLKHPGCEPIGLYNSRGLSQCNPQVRWIERIKIDFIGRFELLEEGALRLQDNLGLKSSRLPHLNKSQSLQVEYKAQFCEESKHIVEDVYREDFEHFGYPIESF